MAILKFELLHQTSLGHPFYQHELASADKESNIVVFVASSKYPYKAVINFIKKDFIVIVLSKRIIGVMKKAGLITQNYNIQHKEDYSLILSKSIRKHSLEKESVKVDFSIAYRESEQSVSTLHQKSCRDYGEVYLADSMSLLNQKGFTFNVVNSVDDMKEGRDARTIETIRRCLGFIGTNSGPYVVAESLRKPCLLLNVLPFFGTNGYHKIIDRVMPCLIYCQIKDRYLSIVEIVRDQIYLMDEEQARQKGFVFERLDKKLVGDAIVEFAEQLKNDKLDHLTKEQSLIRGYVQEQTGIKNPPVFPVSYIKANPWLFNNILAIYAKESSADMR